MPPLAPVDFGSFDLRSIAQRTTDATRTALIDNLQPVSRLADFTVPILKRVGDTKTVTIQNFDRDGRPTELIASFVKVRADIVHVEIRDDSLSRNGTAAFDVHFFESGAIRGYDTVGNGRINLVSAPSVLFAQSGVNIQLSFDDSQIGTLDFSSISQPAQYVELLQGTGAGIIGDQPVQFDSGDTVGTDNDDTITGTSSADTIFGLERNDPINGLASNDTIRGGAGNDTIDGGSGNDTLVGGNGADTLTGGAGTDTVDYSSDSSAVTVNLTSNSATDGNGDTDTLSGIENVTGSNSNDTITGSSSANTLNGGSGNDTIDDGSGGTDTLTGGAGTDTFVLHDASGTVTISDFSAGSNSDDVINLADVSSLNNFAEVTAAATDVGSDVIIDLGGGSTLKLTGVLKANLDSSDFSF